MSDRRTPQEETERMRNLLSFLLVGAFISVLPVLTFKTVPAESKDIITYAVGQLSGMATMALGFYFTNKVGQDAIDAKRTDNTGKALDAITATAKAANGDSKETAANAADQVADAAVDAADQVKGKA